MIQSCTHSLFSCLVFAFASVALAQDKPTVRPTLKPSENVKQGPGEKASTGAPSEEDMAKMMEVWKNAAKPGEFHAKLKPLAGTWSLVSKARMSPDQPWDETTGTAEYRWILGDRVIAQQIKANPGPMDKMMGYSFEGFGLTGYDNVTKKYWNTWNDNMGTGVMTSTGTVDGSGKIFTFTGSYEDPIRGKVTPKSVLKILGDDKLVFEMYDTGPDGKEFMGLEVTYIRKK